MECVCAAQRLFRLRNLDLVPSGREGRLASASWTRLELGEEFRRRLVRVRREEGGNGMT